jgi:hypothetical protein
MHKMAKAATRNATNMISITQEKGVRTESPKDGKGKGWWSRERQNCLR